MPIQEQSADAAATCRVKAAELKCALVLPTYNNERTLAQVIATAREWVADIIVVNDGSTDATASILAETEGIDVINYADGRNRGKGYALMTGLRHAASRGYTYAVTMDTDGQHFPDDIPTLLAAVEQTPGALVIGARNLSADGMPGKNTFANKFSNFWFRVETLIDMADTQSGFRLYPLDHLADMKFFTPRYEFEIEVAVRLAWKGVPVFNVPIKVLYPEDRVSHFRPGPDFFRISVLNTVLVTIALLYFYPLVFLRWLRDNLLHSGESPLKLSTAVAIGAAISVAPAWGFQTLLAIGLSFLLRLNKVITVAFATLSIPPLIPFIIYASVLLGSAITGREAMLDFSKDLTIESVAGVFGVYAIGALALSAVIGALFFIVSWPVISIFRKPK